MFNLSLRLTKVQHHYSLTNAFQLVFSGKAYCKVDFKREIFPKPYNFLPIPTIKYGSDTTVLNDNADNALQKLSR